MQQREAHASCRSPAHSWPQHRSHRYCHPAAFDFSSEQLIHTARCERLPAGEGNIDVRGLFAALPQDLPVSVEVVNLRREAATPPRAWAAECLEKARGVIEGAPANATALK
jgi:sugar phosphate isomerase/epimerase